MFSTPRVLLIDNEDSYTYNLVHLIGDLTGRMPEVVGNDVAVDWRRFSHLVISPGPGHPADPRRTGRLAELIMETDRPLLGVCLGHQVLGLAFGARVVRIAPRHGAISRIRHLGVGVFAPLPPEFPAVRYHSLAVTAVSAELEVTATAADDDVIMGLRHRTRPLQGVQFHPESVATAYGRELMSAFLDCAPRPHRTKVGSGRKTSGGAGVGAAKVGPGRKTSGGPGVGAAKVGPGRETGDGTGVGDSARRLMTRELAWREPEDVFVAHYADRPLVCWLDSAGGGRYSIMAEPTEVVSGPDALAEAGRRVAAVALDSVGTDGPFRGGYVGYLGYPDADGIAPAEFARVDRFLLFDHATRRLTASAVATPTEIGAVTRWLRRTADLVQTTPRAAPPTRTARVGPIIDPDPRWYRRAYQQVQAQLRSGDSYEVNLTFRRRLRYHGDHAELYRWLRRSNPAPYAAFLRLPAATVLSSSPECFLAVDDHRRVQTRPIKGTAPRDPDPVRDHHLRDRLSRATKTVAENLMITDLLRHDLGRSCRIGTVAVPELMAVESYPTLHQLVTTVTGQLSDDVDAAGCVAAAWPPGSMTGAPKKRTMEIIAEVEESPRGVYAGVLGYLSYSGSAEFSVVIRTIVADMGELTLGIGGGVIALSDPDEEYAEALLKSEALITAIQASDQQAGDHQFGVAPATLLGSATPAGR